MSRDTIGIAISVVLVTNVRDETMQIKVVIHDRYSIGDIIDDKRGPIEALVHSSRSHPSHHSFCRNDEFDDNDITCMGSNIDGEDNAIKR